MADQWFSPGTLFPSPIKLTPTYIQYNWNIVESGIKHHNPDDRYNHYPSYLQKTRKFLEFRDYSISNTIQMLPKPNKQVFFLHWIKCNLISNINFSFVPHVWLKMTSLYLMEI